MERRRKFWDPWKRPLAAEPLKPLPSWESRLLAQLLTMAVKVVDTEVTFFYREAFSRKNAEQQGAKLKAKCVWPSPLSAINLRLSKHLIRTPFTVKDVS